MACFFMKKLLYPFFFLCVCFSLPSIASKRDKTGRKPTATTSPAPSMSPAAVTKTALPPEKQSLSGKKGGKALPPSSGKAASFDLSAFKKMLNILDREDVTSEKYKRAARDLEASYYHNSSFETLELLSDTYKEKGDERNQIKVLERIILQYPDKARGYYLLGMTYKNKYDKSKELEKDRCRVKYSKTEDENNKLSAVEALSQAIKKDPKHEPSYLALLPLLREVERVKYPSGQGKPAPAKAKTKASKKASQKKGDSFAGATGSEVLNLVKDMVRYFRKPEYYVELCEAYYSNGFPSGQVRRACRLALKKQPDNPVGHLYLALAQTPDKVESYLIETANRFPQSEMIQSYVAEWFLDKNSDLAVKYFSAVTALNPKNAEAYHHLAELFLKAKAFEKVLKAFKTICLLDFKYIRDFEKAKEKLFYADKKTKDKLLPQYEKGINECFKHFKKHKSCPEN